MKKTVLTLVVIVSVALVGCSTAPVAPGMALTVPADRIYSAAYLQPSAERTASIVIARDKGFSGSGCSHDIFLNNEKILAIRHAEAVTLHVAPGAYFLKLATGGGLCPNISTSQNLTLATGERQDYRVLLPSDGSLRLTRER